MDAKTWMLYLIIIFAVHPICIQDATFKMSSASPAYDYPSASEVTLKTMGIVFQYLTTTKPNKVWSVCKIISMYHGNWEFTEMCEIIPPPPPPPPKKKKKKKKDIDHMSPTKQEGNNCHISRGTVSKTCPALNWMGPASFLDVHRLNQSSAPTDMYPKIGQGVCLR